MQTSTTFGLDPSTRQRIAERLQKLYGAASEECLPRILDCIAKFENRLPRCNARSWDPTDVLLITYADIVRQTGESPLETLRQFLKQQGLEELLSTVHLLPFFPSSSDDGFSVVDYRAVDPALGNWEDVAGLREDLRLAFDLVLNHISSQSGWFAAYKRGEQPYTRFFIEVDPTKDLSAVTRPRSSPLLTPVETRRGTRHVWTTFSADQIDLNYAEPAVLVAMLEVLLHYVARGAQIIRLDAVAYLWKQIGTPCIHLWQTHEVVKLLRDVLSAVAPHVWLLTETNVPHQENVSYFGDGDEAQMVYQFALPPLLLSAFAHGDATPLSNWLADLEATPPGTTFLNFTASHDGIGLRPLEGLVSEERIGQLVAAMRRRGGLVSSRRREDGVDVPYELNITYVDALAPDDPSDAPLHARRFLSSQAVMLAMRGIPAVYFHSLFGTRNDTQAAAESGQPRRINRRKFALRELLEQIDPSDSLSHRIYAGFRRLLEVRRRQAAFHPDASQQVLDAGDPAILALLRTSLDRRQRVLVAVNVSTRPRTFTLAKHVADHEFFRRDLIADRLIDNTKPLVLDAGQSVWLST